MADWWGAIAEIAADSRAWSLANPEITIFFVTAGAGFLSWLGPQMWKRMRQRRSRRFLPENTFPFEVIPPESEKILPMLLSATDQKDTDLLANFSTPYQGNCANLANTQATLEQTLTQ